MIQSTELRTTNLVSYNGFEWAVTAIDLNKLRLSRLTNEGSESVIVLDEHIEGIPLTEQWLNDLCLSKEFFHDGVVVYKFEFFNGYSQGGKIWFGKSLNPIFDKHDYQHLNTFTTCKIYTTLKLSY